MLNSIILGAGLITGILIILITITLIYDSGRFVSIKRSLILFGLFGVALSSICVYYLWTGESELERKDYKTIQIRYINGIPQDTTITEFHETR